MSDEYNGYVAYAVRERTALAVHCFRLCTGNNERRVQWLRSLRCA